jgi:hypothetical protein
LAADVITIEIRPSFEGIAVQVRNGGPSDSDPLAQRTKLTKAYATFDEALDAVPKQVRALRAGGEYDR